MKLGDQETGTKCRSRGGGLDKQPYLEAALEVEVPIKTCKLHCSISGRRWRYAIRD